MIRTKIVSVAAFLALTLGVFGSTGVQAAANTKQVSFRSWENFSSQQCFELERMFRFSRFTEFQGAMPRLEVNCFFNLEVKVNYEEASLVGGRLSFETTGFPHNFSSNPRVCYALEDLVNRSIGTGAFFQANCFSGSLKIEIFPNN